MEHIAMMEIKQVVFFMAVLVLAFSCKSAKTIASGEVDTSISTRKIISNHYENHAEFRTLKSKVKIDYFNGKENQAVSVILRMEKDKVIWISAPLGIVKAHITPKKVSFYNKLQGEYFDGDFGYLNQLLGAELDFESIQNLLLGNAMHDLRNGRYTSGINNGNYQLKPRKVKPFHTLLFQLEPKNFKISTQEMAQPKKKRRLSAKYTYQDISGKILPNLVKIVAVENDAKIAVDLNFKNLELNKTLNFPYKIPKGYDEIQLK